MIKGETATRQERQEIRAILIGHKAEKALRFQTVAIRHFGPAAGIFARQLLFWDGKGVDPNGWIYKSINELQEETGLSRRQQDAARKRLRGTGKGGGKPVLEEKRAIGPDGRWRLFYRLDLEALAERLGDDLKGPEDQSEPSTSAPVCSFNRAGTMPTLANRDYARLSGQGIQKSTQKNTPEESYSVGGKQSPPTRKDSSNQGEGQRWVTHLTSDLEKTGRFLSDEKAKRYGAEFKKLVRKGVPEEELHRVVARIVSEYPRIQLWPQDALTDLRGNSSWGLESKPSVKPSPEPVVEALKTYDRDGDTSLRCFAALAERWDFTKDEEPPFKILARFGQTDEERHRYLERVQSVARRAVRESGTPAAGIAAIEEWEEDGRKVIAPFASLARKFDFTSDEHPPFPIFARLGNVEEERNRYLKKLRNVSRRAVREAASSTARPEESHREKAALTATEESEIQRCLDDPDTKAGRLMRDHLAGREIEGVNPVFEIARTLAGEVLGGRYEHHHVGRYVDEYIQRRESDQGEAVAM